MSDTQPAGTPAAEQWPCRCYDPHPPHTSRTLWGEYRCPGVPGPSTPPAQPDSWESRIRAQHPEMSADAVGRAARASAVMFGAVDPPDPTHGRIDRDIQAEVDEMRPTSLGQRVAIENTLQAQRDARKPPTPPAPDPQADLVPETVTPTEAAGPLGPGVPGRAWLGTSGLVWMNQHHAPTPDAREVLLVSPAAGRVLYRVREWRQAELGYGEPGGFELLCAAVNTLAAAVDALDGDQPAEPAPGGAPDPAWAGSCLCEDREAHDPDCRQGHRGDCDADCWSAMGCARRHRHDAEPAPEPDSGPGWSRGEVEAIADHLAYDTGRRWAAAQLRALLASHDQRAEVATAALYQADLANQQRDTARAEQKTGSRISWRLAPHDLPDEAAHLVASEAAMRHELAEVTAERDAALREVERLAAIVGSVRQLAVNQQSWIDAGRVEQAISREVVRDTLLDLLGESPDAARAQIAAELAEQTGRADTAEIALADAKGRLAEVTAERDRLRLHLAVLRLAIGPGIPTDAAHEAEHRRMHEQYRQAGEEETGG